MMEEYMALLANFGFPVAVCFWFMFRTEKVINNNSKIMARVLEKL